MFLVSLSYTCVISLTFVWGYTFIYNNNIIQRYADFLHIPRPEINQYLQSILHKKYGSNIIQVNVEENSEDDDNKPIVASEREGDTRNRLKNQIIGVLFSMTLALSIGLVILMMCELADYLEVSIRLSLFKFTIDTLMFLLIFMLPFCIISLFMTQDLVPFLTKSNWKSAVVTIILFIIWFFILHKCGDLTHKFSPRSNNNVVDTTRNLIERKVNEISIVGITILAILSGIGCTSTPYRVFNIERLISRRINQDLVESNKQKQLSESDINTAIQYFNNTTSILTQRKLELERLTITHGKIYNMPEDINSSSDGILIPKRKDLRSFIHRVQSFTTIPTIKGNTEQDELTKEIESLKNLRNNLYDDILKISSKFVQQQEEQRKHTTNSRGATILVKILYLGNIIFGVYCVYRIINVFVIKLPLFYLYGGDGYNEEELAEEGRSKDALATTLAGIILTIFKNLPISKPQLVNQLSFVISGGLFICSFNNVLITFKSFSKFFTSSSSDSTKNWLKHLIIGELIGIYVIATALLIRTNLPTNLSNQISKILSLSGTNNNNKTNSNGEVLFIDNWFDRIFAISCIVTTIVLIIKKVTEEDDLDPYSNEEYDEESLIEHTDYKLA
ncbi:Golgi pH regulator [Spathaspora sp. JA1]|nr:Golgi pH regulator [Spathaspora sp. JA1]